ncbi:hypothetical protein D9758_011751 [Tetrapyrgos nigripes]|uniref:Fatty acid hydroxylase domain-containing protein n=1 Tax=Tetrapyrgos nigripes TaxID=182062 RepID=A0A8H5CY81_9AGAR|nr:hypothetical protein D9758_011751 [Tetrapyrgos nigripes]
MCRVIEGDLSGASGELEERDLSATPSLFEGVSDPILTLAAPVLAYWVSSLVFHVLDISGWKWLDSYRLHDSEEVKSKNLVSKTDVLVAVVFQHIVQTALGYFWLEDKTSHLDHARHMDAIASWAEPLVNLVLGETVENKKMKSLVLHEVGYYVYWWAIPTMQMLTAIHTRFIIDTWQYFLHRFMHVNKWFYKRFHSWHHRLYVPYAFGALYNHPMEGFVLDTLGAALAEYLTCMTTRQAMMLFTVSTFKTVDDHCGYKLPFDLLQLMSGNNADYHDIHHQQIGIKSNFAQPFFIHWDVLLGTRMTREELESRRKKNKGEKAHTTTMLRATFHPRPTLPTLCALPHTRSRPISHLSSSSSRSGDIPPTSFATGFFSSSSSSSTSTSSSSTPSISPNAQTQTRLFSTTPRASEFHFDTHQFVQRLEREGLNRAQAEGIMSAMAEVIDESVRNMTSNMVTKAEQEKHHYTQQVDFAQMKSELQLMEKNDLAMIKAENDRLVHDVEKLKQQLREQITRTMGGVRLDMNLEKGKLGEQATEQELKLKEAESKIEQEIAALRTSIQASKATTLQYLVGIVTGGAALLMAYLRFRS